MAVWLSLFISAVVHVTAGEIFTSTARLAKLFSSGEFVLRTLDDYISREEERIRLLKSVREELQTLGSISSDPRLNAGEHPIGAYHVVKVFHNLFRESENATANTNAFKVLLKEEDVLLPSENDSYGALSAILRLQQIYSLSTRDLMTGDIQGRRVRGLTARDAKALGDHAAAALRFQDMALEWWEAANRALSPQLTVTHQEHVDLLLKIAQAYIQVGDVENASKLVNQSVLLYAGNPDVASEVEDMRNMMEDIRTDGLDLSRLSAPEYIDFDWSGNYSGLCRGDPDAIISHPTTSFCTMTTSLGPYVPVKTEILSLHPFIALYYDVVSEKETKEFKLESFKMLQRARVGNLNDSTVSESRVGQLTWISDTVPFIKRVSKRVMAITGLDVTMRDLLSSSEPFQVVNYGIGGHYEPHFDYYPDKAALEYVPTFIKNTGERMATFLYYLDEVLAGGATVFPRIGVRVPPVKNAAAFWYNLQRSGEKDDRTLHAGCPVLLGQKWVANKWIREHGQAFRHGCGSSPDAQHYSFEL